MKVVYLKIKDPISWSKPDTRFYEEDLQYAVSPVIRVAGLLIFEDNEKIVLGEHNLAEDNPKLVEWGVEYPHYRDVAVILKSDVVERKDFETESAPNTKQEEEGQG